MFRKLDAAIDIVEARLIAKIEALGGRVDKCLMAINRLDERTKNLESKLGLSGAALAAVIAGIVLQFFFK